MTMPETYTKARFWKCALQVNPHSYYEAFRGQQNALAEDEYNQKLLDICREQGIKIVGIANHGNVDEIDAIRALLSGGGIVVFPGFEMESSEKIHFVCLFPEDTPISTLNVYLGGCGIGDPTKGTQPSSKSANDIIDYVSGKGGVIYAVHCTQTNGILSGTNRYNHIWKNPNLAAVQIPGSIEDLKGAAEGGKLYQIVTNKNPDYKREHPIAVLNAKDIEQPDILSDPTASCLIKMTIPCFDSFRQSFYDPESRVRLNSDRTKQWYSVIERISITGGYLDGLSIELSEHLNTVIGGRGAGKSTLIECLRYALGLEPLAPDAKKAFDGIIKENLGKDKGRVEVTIRSAAMQGRRFVVSRRHGELPVVKDEFGAISSFSPRDLLPDAEIYGQNEIYEIAQKAPEQHKLLARFLKQESAVKTDARLEELTTALRQNREQISSALEKLDDAQQEVTKLPKLQEQVKQFSELKLEEKLKDVQLWEKEKQLSQRTLTELTDFGDSLSSLKETMPDPIFLSDAAIEGLPHVAQIRVLRKLIEEFLVGVNAQIAQIDRSLHDTDTKATLIDTQLLGLIGDEEAKLAKAFKDIPDFQGRSGRDIGQRFKELLKEIERIRPQEAVLTNRTTQIEELTKQRTAILSELGQVRSERTQVDAQAVKRLNKKLDGNMRISMNTETDRRPLIDLFLSFHMENVGFARLGWIDSADSNTFSPLSLASKIREGLEPLRAMNWGITDLVATSLCGLSAHQVMQMEEVAFLNAPTIELNVAQGDAAEDYKEIEHLSKGQQCTAILHLLLLANDDPLVVDQPEDNLDNAFIADRIVRQLRNEKIKRQFIFATHNANIPVFGDAEWIGVFVPGDNSATIPLDLQGAIDVLAIKERASVILEGGREAFEQRKFKYGYGEAHATR